MAEVLPYRGLRYNPAVVSDMGSVMAPPYDVISASEQRGFYRQDPKNVIRLILGHTYPSDTAKRNRYTRAAATHARWQQSGVLMRESEPAFYVYWQDYPLTDGKRYVRKGFLGRIKLEPLDAGVVLGHELTHKKARTDRIALMEACQANLSPLFMVYPDARGRIGALLPNRAPRCLLVDYRDAAGIRHRMWPLSGAERAQAVTRAFRDCEVYIADGHHRYIASLAHQERMRKRSRANGPAPYDYTQVYLTSMHDPGLAVLPIHRILFNLPERLADSLSGKLAEYFDIEPVADGAVHPSRAINQIGDRLLTAGIKHPAFGFYDQQARRLSLLRVKPSRVQATLRSMGIAKPLHSVDVIVLHSLIFEHLLRISPKAQEEQRNIAYVKGNVDVGEAVAQGPCRFAFLMNSMRMDTLRSVVREGCLLPQKTTFFYPKLASGLVFHLLRE